MIQCLTVALALTFAPAPMEKSDVSRRREQAEKRAHAADEAWEAYLTGRGTLHEHLDASRHLLLTRLQTADRPSQRLSAWRDHLVRVTNAERLTRARWEAGRFSGTAPLAHARAAAEAARAGFLAAGGSEDEARELTRPRYRHGR
jgi:hypothetical protein